MMGWLRAILAQRRVDHYRKIGRETALGEIEPAARVSEQLELKQLEDLREAIKITLNAAPAEERFLLSAYYPLRRRDGEVMALLMVTYPFSRFLIEYLRNDEGAYFGGLTQAEIRILYLWPDGGELTPVLPLVRLGRGKMMGVDHNRDKEWVGASAAFWR